MHELRVKHCASATTHVKHCASHVSLAHAAARGDGDHEGGGGEPDRAELNSPFRDRLCDACGCHGNSCGGGRLGLRLLLLVVVSECVCASI